MSSELKSSTARENGKRSRGPTTAQGKRNSSRNALRHGILAQTVVLDEEDRQPFLEFLSALEADLQPATANDHALIENMAVSRWRQMRIWGIEKAGLREAMRKQDCPGRDSATRTALAFQDLADTSRSLDLLNRYEARFDRQYHRALKALTVHKVILPNEPTS